MSPEWKSLTSWESCKKTLTIFHQLTSHGVIEGEGSKWSCRRMPHVGKVLPEVVGTCVLRDVVFQGCWFLNLRNGQRLLGRLFYTQIWRLPFCICRIRPWSLENQNLCLQEAPVLVFRKAGEAFHHKLTSGTHSPVHSVSSSWCYTTLSFFPVWTLSPGIMVSSRSGDSGNSSNYG